jgi:hypothetical protein
MKTPETEPGNTPGDSETADDTSVIKNEKKNAGRRIQDAIISKDPGRKLNLDRRTQNSDRRVDTDPHYNGPARRNIIDRRLNLKDRRKKD